MASDIDNVVELTILATASSAKRGDFGTPAYAAFHEAWPDLIKTYQDPADMLTDGFTEQDVAYKMAFRAAEQDILPPNFKIIRLTTPVAHTWTWTCMEAIVGKSEGVTIIDQDGVEHDCHYVVQGGDSTSDVADAVAALIAALSGVGAVAVGAVVTVIGDVTGQMWFFKDNVSGETEDTTADAGVDDDLDAVLQVDGDWYELSTQYTDANNITTAAGWVQANKKILTYNTSDTGARVAGQGIFWDLQQLSYKRVYGQWTGSSGSYAALAEGAQMLTYSPGTAAWFGQHPLAGVPSDDTLTPTHTNGILSNNGNYYKTIAGLKIIMDGRSAQGQWMDIQHGLDAMADEIQKRVFEYVTTPPGPPYNSKGIAAVGGEVLSAIGSFTGTVSAPGFISTEPGFEAKVTVPALKDVPAVDKNERTLRKVNFTATANGKIQKVKIRGTVLF